MGLFTPAWKSKNEEKALRAVEKMTDRKKLEEVAKTAENGKVRRAAVKKITDQSVLADIARNDKDSDVCKAAVEKIIDLSPSIGEIVKVDKDELKKFRLAAVEKLTDQSVLADIAKNAEDEYLREAAIHRLTVIKDFEQD
jgi:DUF917 family protein